MNKLNRIELTVLFLALATAIIVSVGSSLAQETEPCAKITANIIARDSSGRFVSNANFEIYQQVDDADGRPKPGKKIASGKIDPVLGRGTAVFTDRSFDYALKIWTAANSKFPFWFYDQLQLECGQSREFSLTLSAISFVLRDSQGQLKKNSVFSLYTQRYDVDRNPIKEKQDLIGSFNTGEVGETAVYLSSGRRAIDGNGPDYYVFESQGKSGAVFILYDIAVNDGGTTEVNYKFSDAVLELTDAGGSVFPGNTKIEIYRQIEDADGNPGIGVFTREIYTDDSGKAVLEQPAGVYAARIKGANDQYQYFWDLEIHDQKREVYKLISDEAWDPGQGACQADSLINVLARDFEDKLIPGLKVELYERILDTGANPKAGQKLGTGATDAQGKAVIKANPDPRKKYALKIYDKNANVGDFWFYDELQFVCGENMEINKNLPSLSLVFRDSGGNLKKNQKFSIYAQRFDADRRPITQKSDLVGNFFTDEQGGFKIYLAPDHPYDAGKKGIYAVIAPGEGGSQFAEYSTEIKSDEDYRLEYMFSSLQLEAKDGSGRALKGKTVDFYEQTSKGGFYALGKKLKSLKTGDDGRAGFEYPAGRYAAVIKDDFNQNNVFWDVIIKNRAKTPKALAANLTRVSVKSTVGFAAAGSVNIYSLQEDGSGAYTPGKKIKSIKIPAAGAAEFSLKPDPYLLAAAYGKTEFGAAFYAENGKVQKFTIEPKPENEIIANKKFKVRKPGSAVPLAERLRGYMLLQVEERGEVWYVNPDDGRRYYLPDGETAYEIMRRFGLGITDENLRKIIIGVDQRLELFDYDGDGLPDDTEEIIGTDMYDRDSDNDGHDDGVETVNGYDPLGPGRLPIDRNLSNALKGKILLQVERYGEAWYVNPRNHHRFYLKDGDMAYEIMRFFSLGIKNSDLEKIEIGALN